MTEAIEWQGEQIPIKRSRRKTMALHVRDGQVELRVPPRVPQADLLEFVRSRQDWLTRVRLEQARHQSEQPDFSRASHCPLMDRQLELVINPGPGNAWQLTEDRLYVSVERVEKDWVHAVMADFYKAQARFYLTEKTLQLVLKRGWEGRLTDIRFRRTKTKWGHCTSAGRIQYNWLVMQAPERIVDYLVAHETAHLLHPHHRAEFWAEVERSHPQWRQDRKWLHENGHRLFL
ncbi:M48 family metallopeptidase [Saccharospirillum salsuginis]|uniref:YgjP-like metallopeptidase domain-containing protein n=1 Tax=Saccharospirillum salsuginis TaxID=418750 RepID=A0A918NEN7_9GAMM|nr:SprT family zinc-dependent metalloprotease [Saccharospirillum salsuginis]GGX64817.1 hypothetical protein GCM10007392_35830 [Saccharospirillum salsuginis]